MKERGAVAFALEHHAFHQDEGCRVLSDQHGAGGITGTIINESKRQMALRHDCSCVSIYEMVPETLLMDAEDVGVDK